jgi:hypothetical protein
MHAFTYHLQSGPVAGRCPESFSYGGFRLVARARRRRRSRRSGMHVCTIGGAPLAS